MKPRLLVVDDELSMREFLDILFTKEGYTVETAEGGQEAIRRLAGGTFDVVLTDLKMPGLSGIDVLRESKARSPDAQVIIITAFASPDSVTEALDLGAADYVNKPFRVEELKHVVRQALEKQNLVRENVQLKAELGSRYGFANIFGAHASMREVYDLIKRVSATKSNVLILGETGTGKELVAKAIHFNSRRSGASFVVVNCGAIPESLWESELFGHKKGSYTGAVSDKLGLFHMADKGTLFLDEVGEMPLSIQVKLLRAIQERKILRVGATSPDQVDVRIIAATNRDLDSAVARGEFREDLFYRLNVIAIRIPPLRDRASDVPMLANYFLEKFSTELGKDIRKISEEAMGALRTHRYPGNVRELENIIERAVTLEQTNVVLRDTLPPALRDPSDRSTTDDPTRVPPVGPEGLDLEAALGAIERDLLLQALKSAGGNKTDAAKLLKITFRSLRYRLQKFGLEAEGDDGGPIPEDESELTEPAD